MARRAQPRRPSHHRAGRTGDRRYRPLQRLAGRQFRRHGSRREQRLCRRSRRQECRRLRDHRPGDGAHSQCRRQELAADDRAQQSAALQARLARHQGCEPHHPRFRDHRRGDRRDRGNRAGRLGLRQVRRRPPVPGHARSDPDLRQERVRPQPALPGGVHGEGSARARHRLRGIPRRRLLLQVRRAGRCRDAQPGRRRRVVGDHPRRLAVRQLCARLPPPRLQSGRGGPAAL